MHVSWKLRRKARLAVVSIASAFGLVVAAPLAAHAAYDGGTACTTWSYGQVCASLRQYSQGGMQFPWGTFIQSSGTASPDVYWMQMEVDWCKGTSRSISCQEPANGYTQTWNITYDYNTECPKIWRGGPYDSGACDMSGAGFDGVKGTYYYPITIVKFKKYSSSSTAVMWAVGPVQLDR